jgi:multidrug efflux pump subunit AcrA (membrane-fusion protein)
VTLAPVDTVHLVAVPVRRGQRVEAAETLAQAETAYAEIAIGDAQARLAQAQADLANLRRGRRPEEIAVIEADQAPAQAQTRDAQRTLRAPVAGRVADIVRRVGEVASPAARLQRGQMICGLLTPDEAEGRVPGFDVRRQSARIKREVGYMTQKFSFYEDLTIEENLLFVAPLDRLAPLRETVRATLDWLGLT